MLIYFCGMNTLILVMITVWCMDVLSWQMKIRTEGDLLGILGKIKINILLDIFMETEHCSVA